MTLEQSLKALKSAFSGKAVEVESMSKDLAEVKAANVALTAEVSDATNNLKALAAVSSERDTLAAKVDELTKALAESNALKAQAVDAIETVGKKAASIVAAVGAAPVDLPLEASTKSAGDVWSEYLELKQKEPAKAQAFYDKNRPSILKHLGLK